MDSVKLEHYKSLVYFLGDTLGSNYEVVLHIIDSKDSYIAAIANNHISGRTVNSPLTGLALQLIKEKKYLKSDYLTNYKAKTKSGLEIQGSTFFIKDKNGELEGLLCINFDASKFRELANNVLELANININPLETPIKKIAEEKEDDNDEYLEVLSDNIKDIIYSIIDPSLLDSRVNLSPEMKIDIIEKLDKKGVFQLKGSVSQVAEILNISDPSVYRYLRMIDKKG